MKKIYFTLAIMLSCNMMAASNSTAQDTSGINPEHMPDTASSTYKARRADTSKKAMKKSDPLPVPAKSSRYSYEPNDSIFTILVRRQWVMLIARIKTV